MLVGSYLYGDYVSGKLWALQYNDKTKQVTANREIKGKNLPVVSFGEDEQGEVYFTTTFGTLYQFVPKAK
jgi:quinoprotein glucose dehydrogenase